MADGEGGQPLISETIKYCTVSRYECKIYIWGMFTQLLSSDSIWKNAPIHIKMWATHLPCCFYNSCFEKPCVQVQVYFIEFLFFQALEIDMEAGKINLQDLSYALEHILVATGDDNGIYQAALTAYQGEIKHLRWLTLFHFGGPS